MSPGYDCKVILDTGPIRNLAHVNDVPDWVSSFAAMRAEGYSFSLADQACGELLNQRQRGSIDANGFAFILKCVETFLDPGFPVMLGEIDVMVAIGAEPAHKLPVSLASASIKSWNLFRNQSLQFAGVDDLLEEEREHWRAMFERFTHNIPSEELDEYEDPNLEVLFLSMDGRKFISPPLSIRLSLKIRYLWRQFVRSKKEVGGYNVHAKKKRNDGIDFGLYTYLALPAFLVTTDGGFLTAIQDIPSFQKDWIFLPSVLVRKWTEEGHPLPRWPAKSNVATKK